MDREPEGEELRIELFDDEPDVPNDELERRLTGEEDGATEGLEGRADEPEGRTVPEEVDVAGRVREVLAPALKAPGRRVSEVLPTDPATG